MLDAGFIDETAYQDALENPAELAAGDESFEPGAFGYVFDQALAEARQHLGDAADTPDLVIRTSVSISAQTAAERAVAAVMDLQAEARNADEAALVAMDPQGRVRAMVGGRNYADSQYNRAVQARRQPGSAFKPVVFAAAFEAGMEPSTAFNDEPIEIEGWSPENYGGNYRGRITIADALKRSINTVAAQAGAQVGADAVAEMGQRLGITTALNPVPALSLGSSGVRLIDMTRVYAVFANDGRRPDPVLVLEVRNSRGDLLYQAPEAPRGVR